MARIGNISEKLSSDAQLAIVCLFGWKFVTGCSTIVQLYFIDGHSLNKEMSHGMLHT